MTETATILPKRPATTDDLARIIADAVIADSQIQIAGSASMPLTALNPARPIQQISTLRLNKLLEHAVTDMTVIAHAGMTLDALQRHLAWQNQWLPVDPPAINGRSPMTRTLGGLIATNSLGPLRLGIGDWRMLIMGTRWIDATGTPIKGGGRTVKNVAGYNTPRMLIGSCGSLGILAEVTLRTFARPADEQAAVFYCPDAASAEALLAAALTADLTPAYIQSIAGVSFQNNILDLPAPPAGGQLLVIGFLGQPDVCTAQVARVRDLPAARPLESIAQTAAQAGRLRLWMTSEPPAAIAFRLHMLSHHVTGTLARLEALAAGHNAPAFLVAEAASGVLRGGFANVDPIAIAPHIRKIAASIDAAFLPTFGMPLPPRGGDIETRLKTQLDPKFTFGT